MITDDEIASIRQEAEASIRRGGAIVMDAEAQVAILDRLKEAEAQRDALIDAM